MKIFYNISLLVLIVSMCVGCGGAARRGAESFDTTIYEPAYATGFTIDEDAAGNTLVRVARPWQGSALEEQTLAIFASEEEAQGYEGEYIVGAADRVVCMSTSHIAMLDAIDCIDAVVGVSGKQYITNEVVANNSAVKDVGYDNNLNYEALVMLEPDLVLMYGVSAANDTVTAKLRDLNIPYLYLGDYTEESPLGKAEWVIAVAEIMGCRERGEEVFTSITQRYNDVCSSVMRSENAPKVMFNLPYQDVWYMPSDDSYMVQLVEDAGGTYIYKGKNPTGGSKPISLEEAYMLVSDADIWLNAGQCSTMEELRGSAPHFANTPVVLAGEVYNNNRRRTEAGGSDFWESAIVRPDVVLSDLVTIIAGGDDETFYYQKLQ
jgi:iron complex transport system substrate-binding protein